MKKFYILLAACLLTLPSFAQKGEDVTSLLTGADCSALADWTNNGFKINTKGTNYALFSGNFIEQWKASTSTSTALLDDISIEQTVSVDNGYYLFSAACIACQQGFDDDPSAIEGVFLYANADEVPVATGNGEPQRFYVLTQVTDGSLTVGFKTASTTANWVAWDNAQLAFYAAPVQVETAIAAYDLQAAADKAEGYSAETPMQTSVFEALETAKAVAADALAAAAPTYDQLAGAKADLEAAMAAADASIAAYKALNDAIAAATATYEKYIDAEDVDDERDALLSAIDGANEAYAATAADAAEIESITATVAEAETVFIVAAEIYVILDQLDYIIGECEVGTEYGQYPEAQMTKITNYYQDLDDMTSEYEDGNVTAAQVLELINTIQNAIQKFYASMITIDFNGIGSSRLWPYDDDFESEEAHTRLFSGDEGPWTIGNYLTDSGTIVEWTLEENVLATPPTSKSDEVLGWAHDSDVNLWLFVLTNGYFHPLTTNFPAAIYTANHDGIHCFFSSVTSQDADRVAKSRGDLATAAYYVSAETGEATRVGNEAVYNYNTDPAQHHFFINMKEGDKVALVAGINTANGNALSRIDTLYVLGSKNADEAYTRADVEESGLLFFNPYQAAEDWSGLQDAIAQADDVLKNTRDNNLIGEGFAMYTDSVVNVLDSIRGLGVAMYDNQMASQPEADGMAAKILKAIDAFYSAAGYGLCLGTQEAPSDSTLFVDHQYMPDGLYYIRDASTGLFVTAPASSSDKQSTKMMEILDPEMKNQDAQVWHFAFDPEYSVYGVASHSNDGSTWTLEDELAQPNDAAFYGYYHIAETGQARVGTTRFLLEDRTTTVWRTFRVYYNGTRYSLTGANGEDWIYTLGVSGGSTARVSTTGEKNFAFELIPYDPAGNAIQTPTDEARPVATATYNVQGMRIYDAAAPGIVITRTLMSDGTVRVEKHLNR